MQKFRTLGPSFELAKIVDVTLPDINFIEKVVNPRNLAIHQAKSFESSEAYSVVRAVDQLLQMLSPQYHE